MTSFIYIIKYLDNEKEFHSPELAHDYMIKLLYPHVPYENAIVFFLQGYNLRYLYIDDNHKVLSTPWAYIEYLTHKPKYVIEVFTDSIWQVVKTYHNLLDAEAEIYRMLGWWYYIPIWGYTKLEISPQITEWHSSNTRIRLHIQN